MNAKKCKELRRIVRRQVPADKRATSYRRLKGGTLLVERDCARGYYLLLKRVARGAA